MKGILKLSKRTRRLIAGAMAFVLFAFQTGITAVEARAEGEVSGDGGEYEEETGSVIEEEEGTPHTIYIMRNPKADEDTKWVPYVYHWYDPSEDHFLTLGEGLLDEYWSKKGPEGLQKPEQGKWKVTPPADPDHPVLTISGNGEASVYQPGTVTITYTYEPTEIPVATSSVSAEASLPPVATSSVPEATPGEAFPPVQKSVSWRITVVEANESLNLIDHPVESKWEPSGEEYANRLNEYKNEMPGNGYSYVIPYKEGDYRYYHISRYVTMKEIEMFNLLDVNGKKVHHLYCSDMYCPDAAGAWYTMTGMGQIDQYLGKGTPLAGGNLRGKLVSVLRNSYPYIEYDDMIAAMRNAGIIGTRADQILESTLDYNQIITAVQTVIWKLVNVPDEATSPDENAMTLYDIEVWLWDDTAGKEIDSGDDSEEKEPSYIKPQMPLFVESNKGSQFTQEDAVLSAEKWNNNVCRTVVIKNFDIIYNWLINMSPVTTGNENLPVNPTVTADPVQFNAVNNSYSVNMSISLDVPVKTDDDIEVSIYKCDETTGKLINPPVISEKKMGKSILSLELTDLAAGQYRVKIDGTRYLPKDIYFYVSQDQLSQCFIGAAEDDVGISGEASFSIPFEEAHIQVLKTADDYKTPVEGAEFGLFWHSGDGNDIQIDKDVTKGNGILTFTGLSKSLIEQGEETGKYYYIQELSAPTGYVKSDQQIRVTSKDIILDDSGQPGTPPLYQVSITNSYQTGSLKISKAVKDNAGNERNDLSFSFSVVISHGSALDGAWKTFVDSASAGAGTSANVSVDDTAKTVTYSGIMLGNGGSFAISGIPAGASYQVTEDTEKVTVDEKEVEFNTTYTVTAEKSDGTSGESTTGTDRNCSGEIGDDSLIVTAAFTNTIQTPEPDTSSSSGSTEETGPSSEPETTGPSESSPESETTVPSETVPEGNTPEGPGQNPNVEIPEEEVPLTPQIPYEEIADTPVPLADANSLTEIQDEDVPLAYFAPMTGDEKPIGVAALFGMIALGMMGVFGILASKKREDEI